MTASVELQVISKVLTSDNVAEVDELLSYGEEYYSIFRPHIQFILAHRSTYGSVPDVFTFQSEFTDVTLVQVSESQEYLLDALKKNRQRIILVETFNKIKDLDANDVSDAWRYLSSQCNKIADLNPTAPMDIISDAPKRAEQVIEFSKQTRIPTGFAEIDKLMYGGLSTVEELLLIIARSNTGKAQPLSSKVLTPAGWKTMGDIKIGDVVVGKNNDNGKVIQVFPQGVKDYYKVTFDDHTFTYCCKDHLWEVVRSTNRFPSSRLYNHHEVLTTEDIINTFDQCYSIDISDAIEFTSDFDSRHELDPYLLGVIIGDGTTRDGRVLISNSDDEIWAKVEAAAKNYGCYRSGANNDCLKCDNWNANFIRNKLKEYGLFDKKSIDKFIPKIYLTAPIDVRMQLLAGLVDTDGYVPKNSSNVWEFDTASEQLAFDFAELARSLGVRVTLNDRHPSKYTSNGAIHKGNGIRHLYCRSTFNPFTLSRKHNRLSFGAEVVTKRRPKGHYKKILSIELVGQTECQCILLDNISHTYITDDYIVTHNTWVTTRFMESAQANGFPVAYYSPEMQASYLATRFDTWRAHFQNNLLYQGKYSDEYKTYITKLSGENTPAYIIEDKDMPDGVSPKALEDFIRQHGIKLMIVDGLSYMSDDKPSERDHEKYKHICADLFRISKKYGCAMVIAVQANRDTQLLKDDKGEAMPTLYNIEGSDHPGRICTQAFSLRQVFDKHVLDIRLEKSRMANNQKPILSYAWDVNTGNCQYLSDPDNQPNNTGAAPRVQLSDTSNTPEWDDSSEFEDEDVEF